MRKDSLRLLLALLTCCLSLAAQPRTDAGPAPTSAGGTGEEGKP